VGETVFADEQALKDLNRITHKYISAEVEKRLDEWAVCGGKLAAIDAAVLIESGLGSKCDTVVGVVAPYEERIRRLQEREGISEDYARARIDAQQPDGFYKEYCGYVLDNGGGMDEFRRKCEELFSKIIGR
jgi:dephospho-CoA kinase